MSTPSSISEYLLAFERSLRVGLGRQERILAEVEDHLRAASAELVATGATSEQAEAQALARFGPPHEAARRFGTDLAGIFDVGLWSLWEDLDRWRPGRPWRGTLVALSPVLVIAGPALTWSLAMKHSLAVALLAVLALLVLLYFPLALRARAVASRGEPSFRAASAAWAAEHPWGNALIASPHFLLAMPLAMLLLSDGLDAQVLVWFILGAACMFSHVTSAKRGAADGVSLLAQSESGRQT